jgi:mannan endo-1,4-beta-mannosidase
LAAAKTADKNALPITQSVLAFLANLPGKTSAKVVSGQLADTESRNWTPIQTNYGVLPGLMGFSQDCFQGVGVAGCTLGGYRQVVPTQDVINHWNAGGLVMTTENPPNPKTLGRQTDTNFTQADMTSLLSQTGTIWSNYKAFLDASATLYATLQAAGVVVIIHMLHEMNAGWFWYGAAEITPAQYISLWQMQFNYYTVTKGLHNLLFTYGPDPTSGNLTAYYPGDNFIPAVLLP